ncbi:MAG: DUF1992 domain-containing protein [Chloroflexi bacterium]|nr:DUF1992 domain-containing protein [Chloroflexota bacterium]
MKKWERIVDRLISDAIGDGDVSHLSGAGKRLPTKDESHTPSEWRAAFKIMDDHDVMPEWVATGARLDKTDAALRKQIKTRAQQHRRQLARARATSQDSVAVESDWIRYRARFLERVERYNREALVYNLTLPRGIPHRRILRGEALIEQALQRDS